MGFLQCFYHNRWFDIGELLMENKFVSLLERAIKNEWCVSKLCTTCHSDYFRKQLAEIKDIGKEIESLDLDELTKFSFWSSALYLAARDRMFEIDWTTIFEKWHSYARGNIEFADHVYFYLLRWLPCSDETSQKWTRSCVDLAIKSKNNSLLESLIRCLGEKADTYDGLVETAISQLNSDKRGWRYEMLQEVLRDAGFIWKAKSKPAAHKLFGAIRRNDQKAIKALVLKNPDFSVCNAEGQTVIEYAHFTGNSEIVEIVKMAMKKRIKLWSL